MTTREFEIILKELDQKFEIIQHPNNPELAGVYYDRNEMNKTGFVITVPSQKIEDEFRASYQDETGHPHNWGQKVMGVCIEHLRRMQEMPGYKEDFYEPLPTGKAHKAHKV